MFALKQDPLLWIYLHPQVIILPQKNHSQSLHKNNSLTIFHLTGNTIRAYQSLRHQIMALKSNMEVFMEVLEPLVEVATCELDAEHVHNFDINFHVKKHSMRLLDCE